MADEDWKEEHQGDTALEEKIELERPRKYRVILHNDDYTSMEFVVYILTEVFRKNENQAVEIMMHVHKKGFGVAGVYPREIAETKIKVSESMAKSQGFPLRLSMESEGD